MLLSQLQPAFCLSLREIGKICSRTVYFTTVALLNPLSVSHRTLKEY